MTPREFLKKLGTENIPHETKSFYEHLCNVEDILKICKCSNDVCLAGLFHSIYGTVFFNPNIEVSRKTISDLIGYRAEYLAWLFCNAQRPFCWYCGQKIVLKDGTVTCIDEQTLQDLRMIEGANLLEQNYASDLLIMFTVQKNDKNN